MSEWIKCDKCNKITQADSSGDKRYKIGVDDFNGYSTFHVCERCLHSFYLDYLGWVWNDDECQYEPQESIQQATKAQEQEPKRIPVSAILKHHELESLARIEKCKGCIRFDGPRPYADNTTELTDQYWKEVKDGKHD